MGELAQLGLWVVGIVAALVLTALIPLWLGILMFIAGVLLWSAAENERYAKALRRILGLISIVLLAVGAVTGALNILRALSGSHGDCYIEASLNGATCIP